MLTLASYGLILAQAADQWTDVFFGLDEGKRFVLLIVAIGCATGVICTIVGCLSGVINSVHRRRVEMEMKREMLDRGMTADEVAKVIESSTPQDGLDRWVASWGKRKTG